MPNDVLAKARTPIYKPVTGFALIRHPRPDFNQKYVMTTVEHNWVGGKYSNTISCLPSNFVYRPARTTPRPSIAGVVPGIVVGPAGEEIHVDEHGRIKVRFSWWSSTVSNNNEYGEGGWVRVAQLATGSGSVAMWLPEVGDEVLVAFEHGDPRRPVVVGSLYNGQNVPPYPLPDRKDLSILGRQSTTGLKNEIIFDNTGGQKMLAIQGGKRMSLQAGDDLNIQASHNLNIQAGNEFNLNVSKQILMQGNETITLRSGNHYLTISPQGISSSTNIVAGSLPSTSLPRKKFVPSTRRRMPSGTLQRR